MRIAVIGKVDDAEATKWTGDPEVDPGAGEVTVTPANEDAASTKIAITDRTACFTKTFLLKGTKARNSRKESSRASTLDTSVKYPRHPHFRLLIPKDNARSRLSRNNSLHRISRTK